MRTLIGVTLAAALALVGCSGTSSPAPDTGQVDLGKLLEAARSATKATGAAKPAWYGPKNLCDLVDGQDKMYLDAGFVRMVHAELRAAGAKGDAYTDLDLYDMGSPLGALAILAGLRTEKTKYLEIGNEAQLSDDGMDLRVGRFYVKLTARRDIEGQRALVQALAEAVAKAAPAGPMDAALVAPLPADGMLPHTAAYTPAGFLGQEFLKGFREAAYDSSGKRVRLFVTSYDDEAKAAAVAKQWKEALKPAPDEGAPGMFAYKDAYAGEVLVVQRGRYLVGAIGEYMAAKPLVDRVLGRLK